VLPNTTYIYSVNKKPRPSLLASICCHSNCSNKLQTVTEENQPNEPRPNQNQQRQNQLQPQQQQHQAMADFNRVPSEEHTSSNFSINSFLSSHQPPNTVYNEVLDSNGKVREHWSRLDGGLAKLGYTGLEHRCQQIRRMIHQNGIAYTAYGDPSVREEHLQLDPIPQLIAETEWNSISAGLKQRASLLNLALADLYGERELLTDGVLPHEVIFEHPHFQLAYQDLPVAGDRHLHFYSAKLVRLWNGQWWVMSDRTDSPGGWGFALENRISISRAFPNEFRTANVKRLASFFISARKHLIGLAKDGHSDPNIAILSAGAGSKSYFEDSYLARYLGFPLVQAEDLVVRSGRVMLKTLAGLTPIDVILRRRSGFHLDPLELGGVAPGIAGLFQVIRQGDVAIANAPGSGLIESPIMMAFLPRICSALLGAKLILPGVATWWCGESQSLELVLDRIDELNLVPAYRRRTIDGKGGRKFGQANFESFDPQSLSREQRIQLIQRDPKFWVGQEKTEGSTLPVWRDGKLQSGHFSMRAFLTPSGNSWETMPGGVARISDQPNGVFGTTLEKGGTKDIWVLADQPAEQVSLLRHSERFGISHSQVFLSSRMADNLCWLGRYSVRAESGARLLRGVVLRLLGEAEPAELTELPNLVRAMALKGNFENGFAINEPAQKLTNLEQTLPASALDHRDPSSLRSQVNQLVGLSARVRERLSSDAWRVIQNINNDFNSSDPEQCDLNDLLEITNTLIVNLTSLSGLILETMTRTHAYRFLSIGRRLEHSLQIVGLLRVCVTSQNEVASEMLEALLEFSDSILTYTSRHFAIFEVAPVLELLLLDELNPRSLAFQLNELMTNIESLPEGTAEDANKPIRKLAMDILHSVRMSDANFLAQTNSWSQRGELINLLNKLSVQLPDLSTMISNRFFVHSGIVTQMIADEFGNIR